MTTHSLRPKPYFTRALFSINRNAYRLWEQIIQIEPINGIPPINCIVLYCIVWTTLRTAKAVTTNISTTKLWNQTQLHLRLYAIIVFYFPPHFDGPFILLAIHTDDHENLSKGNKQHSHRSAAHLYHHQLPH